MAVDEMWDASRVYTRIKLCWFESLDASYEASSLGCDALGFHIFKKDDVDACIRRFEAILKFLPRSVDRTLLSDLEPEALERVYDRLPLDSLQLYPDWGADVVRDVKRALGKRVLKVMSAQPAENDPADDAEFLARYEGQVDAILLDSFRRGGTGEAADWSHCADIVRMAKLPVFLAGGLTVENVGAAVAQVAPFGVDVETGVSDWIPGGPLVKNLHKCRAFVDAVARADRERTRGGGVPPAGVRARSR